MVLFQNLTFYYGTIYSGEKTMLRNYKCIYTQKNKVPFTNNLYVTLDLKIFEDDKELFKDHSSEEDIEVILDNRTVTVTKAFIGCLSYKKPNLSLDDILKLKVERLRGTTDDFLGCFVWKYPVTGIECKEYPGYRYIPSCTNYAISGKGDVVNVLTKTFKKSKMVPNGYQTMRVVDDSGHSSAYMLHRLVSLAWLDYPADFHEYVINHKDGNTNNNHYSNLELVTQKQNMRHAVDQLLSKKSAIDVWDIVDNKVTTFTRMKDVADYIGISASTVRYWLSYGDQYAFLNRYRLKRSVVSVWSCDYKLISTKREIDDVNAQQIVIKDHIEDKIYRFETIDDAVVNLDLDAREIHMLLNNDNVKVVKGYSAMFLGQNKSWPSLTTEQLKIAKIFDGVNPVIEVTDALGSKIYYRNIYESSRLNGLTPSAVLKRFQRQHEFEFKGLKFRKVNLFT